MATSCSNPAYRRQEQIRDTNQRRLAIEQPFFYDMATKFNTSSCTYLYNWPCGLWNEVCHHGCGFIHLPSSLNSTKMKCCANGALSSVSCNFDEALMMRFSLDEMPLFMRMVTTTYKFCLYCALATLISSLVSENKMNETVDPTDFFQKITVAHPNFLLESGSSQRKLCQCNLFQICIFTL